MTLRRATRINQPAGSRGIPPDGHDAYAASMASCTASSQVSKSPPRRTRAASTYGAAYLSVRSSSASPSTSVAGLRGHRAHLDESELSFGELARDVCRPVDAVALDDVVA